MTSPTGNNKGFSFVEVMVALVVLSAGIVGIYKSFFLCVDYLNDLTCRIYASHLIDAKIADITHSFLTTTEYVVEAGASVDTLDVNNKPVDFIYKVTVSQVPDMEGLYALNVDLSWNERVRTVHMERSTFISK